jgi:hypothetical protein
MLLLPPVAYSFADLCVAEMGEIFLSVYKFYDEKTISAGLEDLLEVSESGASLNPHDRHC